MQDIQQKKKKKLTQALGKVISRLRAKSKLSARAVAYEANLSKTTLLLAEKGELDLQLSTFCKIAEVFYLKPDELLQLVFKELPETWSFIEDD